MLGIDILSWVWVLVVDGVKFAAWRCIYPGNLSGVVDTVYFLVSEPCLNVILRILFLLTVQRMRTC